MLSIALALLVSQNPWQWANDPKYYSGPVIDYCRNGGDCRVRDLTASRNITGVTLTLTGNGVGTTVASIPNFTYFIVGSTCYYYANGAGFTIAPSACSFTSPGFYAATAATILDDNAYFGMDGYATGPTGFPLPSGVRAFAADQITGEFFHSGATGIGASGAWKRVQTGSPVDNGMTYCYGWNDATPGFQLGGNPGADTSFTAVTPTETCTSGTLANAMANQTLPTKTMRVRNYTTQAAINAQCNRVFTHWSSWQDSLPIINFSMGINATTSIRARIGWAKNTVFTTSSDAPADVGAWFRYSTVAGDTNYMACTGDGTTTSCTSTGVAADTAVHSFEIDMSESTAAITFWVDKRARVRKTTNLPSIGATLSWGHDVTAIVATARTMSVGLQCVRR